MDLRSYEYWKESLKGTVYEKELLSLKGEELEDAFLGHLEFGTAGMRGKIGLGINRMNTFTVRRSTKGLAEFIKAEGLEEKGVAIAYDSRNFSREFAFETAWLLAENGIKVYIYETLRSVPQLSFTILELGCAAGVVITASHNPSIYNGYKVYRADGGQATPADAAKITGFIDAVDDYINIEVSSDISGKDNITVIGREMDERYYRKVLTVLSHKDALERNAGKLKVVYSPLNGAGNIPVRHMLKEIGISQVYVVPEQELPDGNFPTVSAPNPEMRDCYSLAFELAKEKGVSVDEAGFAAAFEEHQKKSQAGAEQRFKGGLADHSEATAQLHSATHLLQAALRKVLNDDTVSQKGSNITAERLRFDFSFGRKVTPEELKEVERLVNEAIQANVPITCEEMTVEEAKALGAIGLFESKYGEKVKVYTMGSFSKEICGGPHAKNTGELGRFEIKKEEASSSGVRRIKAVLIHD